MRRKADVIPAWNPDGIIPAHDQIDPTSHARSPYTVSLLDVMTRFGNTETRRDLLQRWLDFRAALHRLGITRGFQWIDGSFVENIEQTRNRSPNDIDLVTLYLPKKLLRNLSIGTVSGHIRARGAGKATCKWNWPPTMMQRRMLNLRLADDETTGANHAYTQSWVSALGTERVAKTA